MKDFKLRAEEKRLRDTIKKKLRDFSIDDDHKLRKKSLTDLRDLAVKLHKSLEDSGFTPKHHGYMLTNRRHSPGTPEFYYHIHPIEDLIKFTYDPHANDDPVDQTIDVEFEMNIYSTRWNHEDCYYITRTEIGWYFKELSYKGPCDKTGSPVLFEALRHDSIQFPSHLGNWFEWLWERAEEKGLTKEEVQAGLNDIAKWINSTEQNAPRQDVWEGLA